jgi:penicillin-binding protein 2
MGFAILIKPHLSSFKNKEKLEEVIDSIVKHFPEYERDKLIKEYKREDSSYNHEFIKIIDYIPYDDFFSKYTILSTKEDIKIESATKRFYPKKELASHIIGYVGKASKLDVINNELSTYNGIIGKNGLEKFYNDKLQGEMGYKDVKVNALNKEIEVLDEREASVDNNIKISLDVKLQEYIQEIFTEKGGAVVVMDATNGELLATASFPEFDNNIFTKSISVKEWNEIRNDLNHPFTNKIINGYIHQVQL